MDRDLARRIPANATRYVPAASHVGPAVIQMAYRDDLKRKLIAMARAGRIDTQWKIRPRGAVWIADVTFLAQPPVKRHAGHLKVAAIWTSAGLVLILGYLIGSALAHAIAAAVPFIAGGLLLLAALALMVGRKAITVIQHVTIK